jgi:hypothetical protein
MKGMYFSELRYCGVYQLRIALLLMYGLTGQVSHWFGSLF